MYSVENLARLGEVRWISRVPETSTEAKQAIRQADEQDEQDWQEEGALSWAAVASAPSGQRWVVVRTTQGEERARATLVRKAEQTRVQWAKALWHLGAQRFACEPDAQAALAQHLTKRPEWLHVVAQVVAHPTHSRPGRPRKDAVPDGAVWQVQASVTLEAEALEAEALEAEALEAEALERAARRQACFLVATNVLDPALRPDQELIPTYKEQGSVERGFAFLKDPLFLASSVFVKKPERIVALSLVMVLCLLVYRLAEHRLREQLAATGQTVPNQVSKPTARPTLRWMFPVFEGMSLVTLPQPLGPPQLEIAGLEPLHEQVLALLGPTYEKFYKLD